VSCSRVTTWLGSLWLILQKRPTTWAPGALTSEQLTIRLLLPEGLWERAQLAPGKERRPRYLERSSWPSTFFSPKAQVAEGECALERGEPVFSARPCRYRSVKLKKALWGEWFFFDPPPAPTRPGRSCNFTGAQRQDGASVQARGEPLLRLFMSRPKHPGEAWQSL